MNCTPFIGNKFFQRNLRCGFCLWVSQSFTGTDASTILLHFLYLICTARCRHILYSDRHSCVSLRPVWLAEKIWQKAEQSFKIKVDIQIFMVIKINFLLTRIGREARNARLRMLNSTKKKFFWSLIKHSQGVFLLKRCRKRWKVCPAVVLYCRRSRPWKDTFEVEHDAQIYLSTQCPASKNKTRKDNIGIVCLTNKWGFKKIFSR